MNHIFAHLYFSSFHQFLLSFSATSGYTESQLDLMRERTKFAMHFHSISLFYGLNFHANFVTFLHNKKFLGNNAFLLYNNGIQILVDTQINGGFWDKSWVRTLLVKNEQCHKRSLRSCWFIFINEFVLRNLFFPDDDLLKRIKMHAITKYSPSNIVITCVHFGYCFPLMLLLQRIQFMAKYQVFMRFNQVFIGYVLLTHTRKIILKIHFTLV